MVAKGRPDLKPTVAIDAKIRARLKLASAMTGQTMSEIAEKAITAHLNELKVPKVKSQ